MQPYILKIEIKGKISDLPANTRIAPFTRRYTRTIEGQGAKVQVKRTAVVPINAIELVKSYGLDRAFDDMEGAEKFNLFLIEQVSTPDSDNPGQMIATPRFKTT